MLQDPSLATRSPFSAGSPGGIPTPSWAHLLCSPHPACPSAVREPPGASAGCEQLPVPQVLEYRRLSCGGLALVGESVPPIRPRPMATLGRVWSLRGRCWEGPWPASSVSPQLGLPEAELHLQRVVLRDQLVSLPPSSHSEAQGRVGWTEGDTAQPPRIDAQPQPVTLLGPPGPGQAVGSGGMAPQRTAPEAREQSKSDSRGHQQPAWPSPHGPWVGGEMQ